MSERLTAEQWKQAWREESDLRARFCRERDEARTMIYHLRAEVASLRYRVGDRVEWNPTGDTRESATVTSTGDPLGIKLDDNGQYMRVEQRHVRARSLSTKEGSDGN